MPTMSSTCGSSNTIHMTDHLDCTCEAARWCSHRAAAIAEIAAADYRPNRPTHRPPTTPGSILKVTEGETTMSLTSKIAAATKRVGGRLATDKTNKGARVSVPFR